MGSKSPAKTMQEVTQAPPPDEARIRVCIRTDVGYEYNLVMVESAVKGLLDPDIPDVFIEVPPPVDTPSVKHKFLHTSRIKEIDVFDEFSGQESPVKRIG